MHAGNGRRQVLNEINITPLTDVFLVLLIIMMLLQTSATLRYAGQIRPPEVPGADAVQQADQNCIIEITGKGPNGEPEKISIDRQEIAVLADLEQPLRSKANTADKAKLLLRADKDASSDTVLGVIDTVQTIAGEFGAESAAFNFLSTITISVETLSNTGAIVDTAPGEAPGAAAPATPAPAAVTEAAQ